MKVEKGLTEVPQGHRFEILHNYPSPPTEKAWRECLSNVDWPSHYNAPEFFLEPFWSGKRPFAVLAFHGNTVAAIATGLNEGNHVISGLQSRPQLCIARTADRDIALRELAHGLLEEGRAASVITVYSWAGVEPNPLGFYHFRRREFEGDVVLDLAGGPEEAFKQLHASRRKNIRHAIRSGMEVLPAASIEDVHAFYKVHEMWHETKRKKIETDPIPREVFLKRFSQSSNFKFMLARHAGTVIAGITLRFFPGGLVEFSNHSSLDEYLHLKPNDLLQWKCIEWAYREGFRRCSFGAAHTFHRRFGGTVLPIVRYRLDRTFLRRHDRHEEAMDLLRVGLRKLPQPIQRAVRLMLD